MTAVGMKPVATPAGRAPFSAGGGSEIDPALATRLLAIALAKGGDHADLFFQHDEVRHFVFEDGRLKGASYVVTVGMGARVRVGGAVGYASTDDLTWEAMAGAAATAAAIAGAGAKGAPAPICSPRATAGRRVDMFSVDAPTRAKHALLERGARAASSNPNVRTAESNLSEDVREILIATSDGRFVRDVQPLLRFAVRVVIDHKGARREGASGGGGRMGLEYFDLHPPEEHAAEAIRQAEAMVDARETPAGPMTVVLAPGDSGILIHESIGHGLEADFNLGGASRYSGKLGCQVASPLCTIFDDATLAGGRGSIQVDDEGNEGRRNVLIEGGRLASYLHDQKTASDFRCAPTGNGRRASYRFAPMPRMTTTILAAGGSDPAEILASVKHGIYARRLGGGQVNIATGSFVFGITEGYLIEDGRLTAPLREANLIGSGPEVLKSISMLGNDVKVSDGTHSCAKKGQNVPVGVGCPTVKIEKITVGGTRLPASRSMEDRGTDQS